MYIGSLNFIRLLRAVISRFFEGEPNEIYRHVSEKGSKGRFFVACVAGTKRGGVGDRERGKREGVPSPSPFSLPPYPLPLSTPATQASFSLTFSHFLREKPRGRGWTI